MAESYRHKLKRIGKSWGDWEQRDVSQQAREFGLPYTPRTTYCNNRYHVQVFDCATPWGTVIQASLGRHGDLEEITWAELQRIKCDLFGDEACAVEVYPPVSQLIDQAPMRHLWILPADFELPFGLHLPTAWGKHFT